MPHRSRPGDILAGRYHLVDLLAEAPGGRFWRAYDNTLKRRVALHVMAADNANAAQLVESARTASCISDPRILRVLDAEVVEGCCYVVNEWGDGASLDQVVAAHGPLGPRRSAWLVAEAGDALATAHPSGLPHGRLAPENVLIDGRGQIRLIGYGVEAAMHGLPLDRPRLDIVDLVGLLYFSLTGYWAGASVSDTPGAPRELGQVLRPRRVRNGVPRLLDQLCDDVLHPHLSPRHGLGDLDSPARIVELLRGFVGDDAGIPAALLASCPDQSEPRRVELPDVPEFPLHPSSATPEPTEESGEGAETSPSVGDEALAAPSASAGEPALVGSRPLFAPAPRDGAPERTPRHRDRDTAAQRFPWQGRAGGAGTPPPVTPPPADTDGPPEVTDTGETPAVPGRSWQRAGLIGAAAIVAAVGSLGIVELVQDDPASSASTDQVRLIATDLDPTGVPPGENPDLAPFAVDGDPATAWRTDRYTRPFSESGRSGVGLVIDLGDQREVERVLVKTSGGATGVALYLTDEAPDSVIDLDPVGEADSERRARFDVDGAGRFLTVWLTELPRSGNGFRGVVRDVEVTTR